MSEFLDISYALDNRLNNMASLPSVAWPNRPYEPIVGTLYLRPTNLQGSTQAETLQDMTVGVYQVDVFAKAGEGKNEAIVMADLVADHFKQNTTFSYLTQSVRVLSVSGREASTNDDGWFHYIVEISYDSFADKR